MVVQCSGEIISEKDKCSGCKGSKVVQEKKVLEVHVEKGMQHGQKIVFQGQADEAVSICYRHKRTCLHVFNILSNVSNFVCQPDTVTGDIVFVLKLKDHPKFKRKYDDLYVEHTISLTEALCGFQFVLTHLDGRQLLIKSNPGEVIKPGTTDWLFLCVLYACSTILFNQLISFIAFQLYYPMKSISVLQIFILYFV